MLAELFLCLALDSQPEWTVEYEVIKEGPIYTYQGRAVLHGSSSQFPCLEYSFEVPAGELFGYCFRFDQFTQTQTRYPMMPFDVYGVSDGLIEGTWCSPAPLADWQSLPRHFKFSVRKSAYNADDLTDMLSHWGTDSYWDLNDDGTVDGIDLALMIGSWVST